MPSTPTIQQRAQQQDHHHNHATSFGSSTPQQHRQSHAGYVPKPPPSAQGPLGVAAAVISPKIATPSNPSVASGGNVAASSNGSSNGRTGAGYKSGHVNGASRSAATAGGNSHDGTNGAGMVQARMNGGEQGREQQNGAIAGPGPSTVQAAAAAAAAKDRGEQRLVSMDVAAVAGGRAEEETPDETYSILFKTKRRRAWEKSRQIDEGLPSREELDEQVRPPPPNPDEQDRDLIPLSAIAQRLVFYAWQLFANQVEINPSISPMERRRRMFNDAVEARKQLIKLLVLARWSSCAEELHLARDIISFINDHIFQTDAAVGSLNETRDILTRARLRSFDVVTAIEVLGAGAPQRLPPVLKELLTSHKQYTDDEALGILGSLNEAISVRLACDDFIPLPMLDYTIDDGRACFVVPSLFEADLTLAGVSVHEAMWQLTRVKFDFKITGSGADRFPRQPTKQQRQIIIYLANAELAPRSVAAVPETDHQEEEAAQKDIGPSTDVEMQDAAQQLLPADFDKERTASLPLRTDAPLFRLYNFLQSQAYNYQLDILHYQAIQLTRLSWGSSLFVHMDHTAQPRTLSVRYWNQRGQDARESGLRKEPQQQTWTPAASATLKITVRETPDVDGKHAILRGLLYEQDQNEQEARGQSVMRLEIPINWEIEGAATSYLCSKELSIDHRDLDFEKVLSEAVCRHARAALLAIKARIGSSSLGATARSKTCRLLNYTEQRRPAYALVLPLHERLCLVLYLDILSGQLRLEEAREGDSISSLSCSSLASQDSLKQLREASKRLNSRPDQIVGILQGLRRNAILEDLEQEASLLGLASTRRLPLRQQDFLQLQANPGSMIFIHLTPFPTYYLVLHVSDEALRVALICAHTFLEGVLTSMLIYSLVWLDRARITSSTASGGEGVALGKRRWNEESALSKGNGLMSLEEEELAKLYSYSLALVSFNKVEQQLQLKSIPFVHVNSTSSSSTSHESGGKDITGADEAQKAVVDLVPTLALRAATLLGPAHAIVKPNLSLKLKEWWNASRSRVEISARMRVRAGLSSRRTSASGGGTLEFDPRTSILTFQTQDVDNCITMFLLEWNRVSKVANLAKELLSCNKIEIWPLGFMPRLEKFDLCSVTFEYAKGLCAEVSWQEDLQIAKGGYYCVRFFAPSSTEKNPHEIMTSTLQAALSRGNDNETGFWQAFLKLLQTLLPILEQVADLDEQCLEKVDAPELEIRSATSLRLIYWEHYYLDIRLRQGGKVIFSTPLPQRSPSPDRQVSSIKLEDKDTEVVAEEEHQLIRPTAIPNFARIASEVTQAYYQDDQPVPKQSSIAVQTLPAVLAFDRGILSDCTAAAAGFVLRALRDRITEEFATTM